MTTAPEVSVIVPTRNRWPLLSTNALPSALGQDDVELEVVIVDDASDDESPDRLAEIDDARVRIVRHAERRGLAGARNTGAASASGTWLAFLDDDDLWSPRKLRAQLDTAKRTGADWVYGRCVVVDAARRVVDVHPFPAPADVERLLHGGNHVPGGGSNVIVRADALRRAGGFDESLRYFEDWDLWLRLAKLGDPGACDEVVVAHVEHGGNMLFRDRCDVLADFEHLLSKHEQVTRSNRLAVAEWLAHEHARAGLHRRAALLYLRAAVVHRSAGNVPAAVGALFGRGGLRAASRLLVAVRGRTHLDEATERETVPEPEWLARYA